MYTRVIGLSVCFALALLGCGDDDGGPVAANQPCTPGEQSKPSGNRATDPCPQNDLMSMCMPFPQMVAVTTCCTDADVMAATPGCMKAGFWRRSCQCLSTQPGAMAGQGGAGGMSGGMMGRCGDGVVQAGAPFNEKCDPGDAAMGKPAMIGSTCSSLGMGGGMVMCSSSCQYDTSMCTGSPSSGGAGGS